MKTDHESRIPEIVSGAVGPFEQYCDGYSNPGASGLGYITTVALSTGLAPAVLDGGLDTIEAFDDAATTGTYTGQVNFLQATSFSGLNGAIWGYDLARADELATASPLTVVEDAGTRLPLFDIEPLCRATRRLLGTRDDSRFRLMPGALVSAAMKGSSAKGPLVLWGALALAIAEDRRHAANLFMEDLGTLPLDADVAAHRAMTLRALGRSVIQLGRHHAVRYRQAFVGYVSVVVPMKFTGAVKLLGPYVVLARRAVPPTGAAAIASMTLSEWEQACI